MPEEWSGLRSPAGIAVNASGMIVATRMQRNTRAGHLLRSYGLWVPIVSVA